MASDVWIHRWAKHAAQNYPIVSRSAGVRFLKDSCHGIPAFVVGIGPSLDDNIEELDPNMILKKADAKGIAWFDISFQGLTCFINIFAGIKIGTKTIN